jgi:hypothetical protein
MKASMKRLAYLALWPIGFVFGFLIGKFVLGML